jgi:hypothetical protein
MEAKPHTSMDRNSLGDLHIWCLLVGLALAPMPILYALPTAVFYHLYDSAPPGWTRITADQARYYIAALGLPVTAIFLAWSLPGAGRPGVPLRSIIVLCLLVAYYPLRSIFDSYFNGDAVNIYADWLSRESPLIWFVRHLDAPLLIGLAAAVLRWRRTLSPYWKVLFHWSLFVCAIWATGYP